MHDEHAAGTDAGRTPFPAPAGDGGAASRGPSTPDPADPASAAMRPPLEPASDSVGSARFNGRNVHLLGIGGCGMNGLARLLGALGASCSGRDAVPSDVTRGLEADGIPVLADVPGEPALPLPADTDLVVASAAIPEEHAVLREAKEAGIPVAGYAEALGMAQADRTGLSIAGTHGKSTTTAMLCHVLIEAGLDPGFIVGANCPQIGGGSRCGAARIPSGPYAGRPGLLVAEACEFRRSFHHHTPVLGAILNVEEDHLDIYGSLDAIIDAFAAFARRLPPASEGGRLLVAHDAAHRRRTTAGVEAEVRTFGFAPEADVRVVVTPPDEPGGPRVRLVAEGRTLAAFRPPMAGDHNALNAAAAAILAHWLGASWEQAAAALESFEGLDRRLSRLGERPMPGGGAVTVLDDYGHHPTEIDATLRAIRASEPGRRIICVFQPHQHSRTRFLLEEFATAFGSADVVIVPQIYFVRDSAAERARVSAADLVDRLRDRGVAAMHLHPFGAIVEQLDVIARPGDVLVVMGAGPVWTVARDFMDAAPPTPKAVAEIEVLPATDQRTPDRAAP